MPERTPWKINMELEKLPIWKWKSSSKPAFLGSMLIFRGVTILSEGSNFESLRSRSAHASHLSLAITYAMVQGPNRSQAEWTHFPLTKLFLSRKKKTEQHGHPKTTGKSHPLQPYLQPTKTPNHGVYLLPTTTPTRPQPLGSVPLLGAVRSKRIRSFDLVPLQTAVREVWKPKNFRAKMPPKMDIFFSGQITYSNNSYRLGPKTS